MLKQIKLRRVYDYIEQNNAQFYHKEIRNHWRIENSFFWVKDVFHNGDINSNRTNSGHIYCSIFSSIAINIQRLNIS